MTRPDRGAAWDAAPVALVRLSPDGTVLDANGTLLEWVGRTYDDVVGRVRLSRLLSVGGRIYWETHLAPLLHMQGRVEEVAVEIKGRDGRIPVLLTAVVRARDDGDAVVEVALTGAHERSRYERELLAASTAAEAAAEQVRVLQQSTAALSQALGVEGVSRALLSAAVGPLGAAGATLWLAGPDTTLSALDAAGTGSPTAPPEVSALDDGVHLAADGVLLVPLQGRARLHGVLVLTPRTGPAADPPDLDMLTAVGQQAGLALERARLHDQTASVAHELQHALLTTHLPPDDRFTVTTVYRPGVQALDVGGDWYDAFLLEHGVLAVVVGDVVGRGLAAATAMGQLRSAVRALAGPDIGPAQLLSQLDRFVRQADVGFMTTMAYAEVELSTGVVRYACAGHPPPLRVPVDGAPAFLWGGRSTPLGVRGAAVARTEAESRLERGDLLLLYTDGLVERRDRLLSDGLTALAGVATSLHAHVRTGRAEMVADALTATGQERDDVCLLIASWAGP